MAQMGENQAKQANQVIANCTCACHHRTFSHCNLQPPPLNTTFRTDLWSSWLGRRSPDPKVAGSISGECILRSVAFADSLHCHCTDYTDYNTQRVGIAVVPLSADHVGC